MEQPYTFARLPQPLDQNNGRSRASPVYTFQHGRRRQRYEVVASTDGESITIYNVQRHTLVASYALPPQTYLCHPPVSIHVRSDIGRYSRRQTCLLVKNHVKDSSIRLILYEEALQSAKASNLPHGLGVTRPLVKEVEVPTNGRIIALDMVPVEAAQNFDTQKSLETRVVVTFASGVVWSYYTSSGRTIMERDVRLTNSDNTTIEYANILDLQTAAPMLFDGRPDLLAGLDRSLQTANNTRSHLLVAVIESMHCLQLRYYLLGSSRNTVGLWEKDLEQIVEYELPRRGRVGPDAAQYEFHQSSGTLYRLSSGRLTIIRLASVVPKVNLEIDLRHLQITAFARVTASTVLVAAANTMVLCDAAYGSILGKWQNDTVSKSTVKIGKRKRDHDADMPYFMPVCAFADLRLVIGLYGQELQTVQLSMKLNPASNHSTSRLLLSDLLDYRHLNGIDDKRARNREGTVFENWIMKANELLQQNKLTEFEYFVIHNEMAEDSVKLEANKLKAQMSTREDGKDSKTAILSRMDHRKANFILRKMFAVSDGILQIKIGSLELLTQMARQGYLSVQNLSRILPHHTFRDGDVFRAVAHFDPSFDATRSLLSLQVYYPLAELAEALRLLLHSFKLVHDVEAHSVTQCVLPATDELDSDHANADEAEAQLLKEAESAAHEELQRTSDLFVNGLEVRREVLRAILVRLYGFPLSAVSSAFRNALTHEDLVFFLELMRLELAYGGWTSGYVDAGRDSTPEGMVNALSGDNESGSSDQAVKAVSDLMNCAIDAVGMDGWLVGLSARAQHAKELIDSLRAEVSASLEGCYEAVMINQLLDTLHQAKGKRTPAEDSHILQMGTTVRFSSAFPLKSMSQKKSVITLAQEKRRSVGKYSIERIRI